LSLGQGKELEAIPTLIQHLLCIGTDIAILFDGWKRNGDQLRQALSEA
jgi:hypothetical protein